MHYAVLLGLVGLLLWLVVPRAIDQVQTALGEENLQQQTAEATGWKRDVLEGVQQRLEELPVIGFEIFIGILFVLACAAYWIFEREHAIRLVTSLLPRPRRKVVRDTWDLIDAKLGAYVRGQALLITLVATTLSLCFWAIGLPFWLLVGVFAAPGGLHRHPQGARGGRRALPAARARLCDRHGNPVRGGSGLIGNSAGRRAGDARRCDRPRQGSVGGRRADCALSGTGR